MPGQAAETKKVHWEKIGRADDQDSDTAYRLATLANFVDFSAKPTQAVSLPDTCNGIRLRFLLEGGDDFTAHSKIWTWDENGAPLHQFTVSITAGALVTAVDPTIPSEAMVFYYADTLVVSDDHTPAQNVIARDSTADQINELTNIDLLGARWILADFDTDAGAGTTATDAICLMAYL